MVSPVEYFSYGEVKSFCSAAWLHRSIPSQRFYRSKGLIALFNSRKVKREQVGEGLTLPDAILEVSIEFGQRIPSIKVLFSKHPIQRDSVTSHECRQISGRFSEELDFVQSFSFSDTPWDQQVLLDSTRPPLNEIMWGIASTKCGNQVHSSAGDAQLYRADLSCHGSLLHPDP